MCSIRIAKNLAADVPLQVNTPDLWALRLSTHTKHIMTYLTPMPRAAVDLYVHTVNINTVKLDGKYPGQYTFLFIGKYTSLSP